MRHPALDDPNSWAVKIYAHGCGVEDDSNHSYGGLFFCDIEGFAFAAGDGLACKLYDTEEEAWQAKAEAEKLLSEAIAEGRIKLVLRRTWWGRIKDLFRRCF